MNQDLQLKLQAWLDGELPPTEAEQLRLLVSADPEAKRLASELQAVTAALRRHEPTAALPEAREFYWSKIQRQIAREESLPPSTPAPWSRRWRLWLAPLVGASALAAVFLLAVHPASNQVARNEVSVTADGYQARTFHDQNSGMNFVFLQETPKTSAASRQPAPARTRDDGSSFMIDIE